MLTKLTKFIARRLGVWSPYELPAPFQGRIEAANLDYDVQLLSGEAFGNVGISISLPRERMLIQPTRFRKAEVYGDVGPYIGALFNMGAQSVDVGFTADKIEAIFPGEIVRVDKAFADQVAGLMLHVRYETLGEYSHGPCRMRRPWSKEAERSIEVDGQLVTFEFSSCFVDTNYEAGTAGNLDVMVRTNPPLATEKLMENLRLALPEFDDLAESDGCGEFDDGAGIVGVEFGLANSAIGFDAEVREAIKSIREANIFWGDTRDTKLASLRCIRASEDA